MKQSYHESLSKQEDQMRVEAEKLHRLKHMAIRDCCPYRIGERTEIRGLLNNGRVIHIDAIELQRSKYHHHQWCWVLSGRIVRKDSGSIGKKKATTIIPVEVYEVYHESNATQPEEPAGEGV